MCCCAAVLLCGSICGAESWRDFVIFGQEKLDFLREYFPFSAGIPCKNTFSRVCAAVEPEQFGACFLACAASLPRVSGEVTAIGGCQARCYGCLPFLKGKKTGALRLSSR